MAAIKVLPVAITQQIVNNIWHNIINAVSRVPVLVPENFKLGCRLPVPEGKMLGCRSTFEPCLGVRQLE